ncbi:MAG: autotransporter outer membrane beta-barrel domain-containing protein [Proteobacteria bacterium]|nr:autotransporter outer membrane beta-barrel domain-containing protein [Pseudomonadota bacterium]
MFKKSIFSFAVLAIPMAFPVVSLASHHDLIHEEDTSNDVASTERTAISVQRVTAGAAGQLINMRFNPLFNLKDFPSPGSSSAAILPQGFISLAAGEQTMGVSTWANLGYNKIEDDFVLTAYDGSSTTGAIGADYQLNSKLTAGISLNFSDTDIDTVFNSGNSQTDGFTFMPYANFKVNDWLSVDVSAGHAWNETKNRRIEFGSLVTGSQDSDGWIVAGNLNAQKWFNQMFASARAGLMYNQDERSSFTESNGTVNLGQTNELVQANIGGSIGYWAAPFMPSLSLTYTNDLDREDQFILGGGAQPANDNDGLTVGLGCSFYGSEKIQGLSMTLSLTSELLREDLTNNGISFNMRYGF